MYIHVQPIHLNLLITFLFLWLSLYLDVLLRRVHHPVSSKLDYILLGTKPETSLGDGASRPAALTH